MTSIFQLRNPIILFTSYQNKSHQTGKHRSHAVDTWTGLLINLIDSFDIADII